VAADLRIVVATVRGVLDPRHADDPNRATAAWWHVRATVDPDAAELAADALWQLGAAGVEEQRAADGRVLLIAGFDAEDAARAGALALGGAEVHPVADDGLDAWRAHARPVRAGAWWLVPSWIGAPPPPDGVASDHVLVLDPDRTFGSGSHPTTRLVLATLDRRVRPGARVLDVGTGSGVLAVAAARLGATEVLATDIDPESPAAVAANARRNGVAARVHATTRPVAPDDGRFDLVLANLLAPVVRELADALLGAVAPGGALVVSGLLADRWEGDVACLAPLAPAEVLEEDGWVAVVLVDPGPPAR
jgi:ribosomal protein L11 methyltransferase